MANSTPNPIVEFGRTIRLSHSFFAMPFALGTALLADPPCPNALSLLLLVACMVAARTAGMGLNRVVDAAIDARNPRTSDRAIPAGRLARRTAFGLTLSSGAAFIGLAWLFLPLRGSVWPGLLAPAFLAALFAYSYAKRFTALTHWLLGLCLGLAPVGVWIALRGSLDLEPVLIGAAVLLWTGGFDVLYAFQDVVVDRREGLHSAPAQWGERPARWVAALSHAGMIGLLAAVPFVAARDPAIHRLGFISMAALPAILLALVYLHLKARRARPDEIAAAFFPVNAFVSIIWLVGVILDMAGAGDWLRIL